MVWSEADSLRFLHFGKRGPERQTDAFVPEFDKLSQVEDRDREHNHVHARIDAGVLNRPKFRRHRRLDPPVRDVAGLASLLVIVTELFTGPSINAIWTACPWNLAKPG